MTPEEIEAWKLLTSPDHQAAFAEYKDYWANIGINDFAKQLHQAIESEIRRRSEEPIMIPKSFDQLLSSNGISMAAVGNLESGVIEFRGDCLAAQKGLLDNLFGDVNSIRALDKSLVGQDLPRIWVQGGCTCIVCKPYIDILVGLFSKEDRDPKLEYIWARKVSKELDELFNEYKAEGGSN